MALPKKCQNLGLDKVAERVLRARNKGRRIKDGLNYYPKFPASYSPLPTSNTKE